MPVQWSSLTWLHVSTFEKMALGNQLNAKLKESTVNGIQDSSVSAMTTEPHRKHMDTHKVSRQLTKNSSSCRYEKEENPNSFAWKNTISLLLKLF